VRKHCYSLATYLYGYLARGAAPLQAVDPRTRKGHSLPGHTSQHSVVRADIERVGPSLEQQRYAACSCQQPQRLLLSAKGSSD